MRTLIPGFTKPIEYPSSDGKPRAETDDHRQVMVDLIARLTAHFADRQDVYVSGNLLVYYEQGNVNRHLSPDCFVVFGVPAHNRDTFRTWEEGAVPSVVFEITSKTTRREDTETKFEVYQNVWRVDEYILFDPTEEYLSPPLAGFRRSRATLVPMKANKDGSLTSRRLGLTFARDGGQLRLHDTVTGAIVLTAEEQRTAAERRQRERAERKVAKSDAENDQMAAEIAKLQAELAALKKKK
jgi:Uma2 family endonuclease